MPAAKYDLLIEQGADYSKSIILKNPDGSVKDLTNVTLHLQIREYHFSDTVLLEGNSLGANPNLIVNIPTGTVTIKFSHSQTSSLTIRKGVYDLEMTTPTSEVIRLMQGAVIVDPEVTR